MRRLAFLTLGLLTACLPELHEVLGRACDDAHPCPDALFCVDGTCRADTPADVTVLDVTFESGLTSFEGTTGARLTASSAAHQGSGALRVSTGETSTLPFGALSLADAMTVGTGVYCASAWLEHGTGAANLSLTLRAYGGANGTSLLAESTPGVVQLSGSKQWLRATTQLGIDASTVSAVRLVVTSANAIPADFFVDDVRVVRAWRDCD